MAIAFVDLVAVKREVYQGPIEVGVFLRPPKHSGSFTECFSNIKNILSACTACILDRYFFAILCHGLPLEFVALCGAIIFHT
jgi:hypothetical protein